MIVFFDLDDTLINHHQAMRLAAIALHSDLGIAGGNDGFVAEWIVAHRRNYPRYLTGQLRYQTVGRLRIRQAISAELSDVEADELFARYRRGIGNNEVITSLTQLPVILKFG